MPQIIESDNIPGIQRLIQRLAAAEGISIFELADRSGVHPTTLYAILKKKPTASTRPVRRDTIKSLAEGSGYSATFDAVRKRVILEKSGEERVQNDVEKLVHAIRGVLQRAGKKRFTAGEKEKILQVVGVLAR